MNTTLTAKSLAGVTWTDEAGMTWQLSRRQLFGVVDSQGRWLSFDGAKPYGVPRRATAAEVASGVITDGLYWIEAN